MYDTDASHTTRRNQMPRGTRHLEVRKRANPQHNLPPLEVSGYLPASPNLQTSASKPESGENGTFAFQPDFKPSDGPTQNKELGPADSLHGMR